MRPFFSLLLATVGLTLGEAQRRNPDEILQSAHTGISRNCEQKAVSGDCMFYACFETRHPCGRDGFMIKHGLFSCLRFLHKYDEFNGEGKIWLNATRQCITNRLLALYRQDSLQCSNVTTKGFRVNHDCFLENNFCSILSDNKMAILRTFDARSLNPFHTSSFSVWSHIIRISRACAQQTAHQFQSWFREQLRSLNDRLHGVFSRLRSSIGSVFQ